MAVCRGAAHRMITLSLLGRCARLERWSVRGSCTCTIHHETVSERPEAVLMLAWRRLKRVRAWSTQST